MSKFYFPDPFASPNICPRKSTFLRPRANETCQRKYRSVSKTMARLKWTIHRLCRCLFPRRLEKRKCNAWKGRNLRNISSGHAWKHSRSFQCHYQQANQRFPDTRMLRGTSERPLSAWHTLGARFRSICHHRPDVSELLWIVSERLRAVGRMRAHAWCDDFYGCQVSGPKIGNGALELPFGNFHSGRGC